MICRQILNALGVYFSGSILQANLEFF